MSKLFTKARVQPPEIEILALLRIRMQMSLATQQKYFSLCKGYEGERRFDQWLEKLECDCLILNDLLLKVNNHMFQIDSLLILSNQIYVFEVKNYKGDFYYKDDRFFQKNKPENEISNPLLQLARTESLLRQLLHKFKYSIPIQSSIIFINPDFMLYQAPMVKPIIFSTQLNRFLQKLNSVQSSLDETHHNLAANIISLSINDNPYNNLPSYQYQDLRKGITCPACHSFTIELQHIKCICTNCYNEEKVEAAVVRSVTEFKLLFPNEKITTNKIYEWCKIIPRKRKIHRILNNNYTKVGVHQWTYYE